MLIILLKNSAKKLEKLYPEKIWVPLFQKKQKKELKDIFQKQNRLVPVYW